MSVGQRDPLVEYRRQSQRMFEEMQDQLRHDAVRSLFHAQPVEAEKILTTAADTELTRAAQRSVANADQIIDDAEEFQETDFTPKKIEQQVKKQANQSRKKAHKAERQRKAKARKRK